MTVVYLEKRADRNMQRHYRVTVALWRMGDGARVGRIGQRGGSRMESWFTSEEEACRCGDAVADAKRRRGYRPFAAIHE